MIVGLDIGFGHVKTVTQEGLDAFPAVVAPWEEETFRPEPPPLAERAAGLRVNGRSFLLGQPALRRSPWRMVSLDREWVSTDLFHVLALGALQRAVSGSGREIRLVTGLPVGDVDRYSAEARAWVLGPHKIDLLPLETPWEVTVVDAHVMPQPFGTLLAAVLNEAGDLTDRTLAQGRIGIIDIGFRTTNYLTVDGLTMIAAASLSRNLGMAELLLALSRGIQFTYGLELDPHDLDEAALQGHLTVSGRPVDLQPLLTPLLQEHAESIAGHATMLWGHGQALDTILVTGGGAEIVGRALTGLGPHVRTVPNPRIQNAVGYYRYGRRLANLWRRPAQRTHEPPAKK